jgi:hypothetical protein
VSSTSTSAPRVRTDPEGFHRARRAVLHTNLTRSGMNPELAERWIAAWEAGGTHSRLAPMIYWQAAGRWIGRHRAHRQEP